MFYLLKNIFNIYQDNERTDTIPIMNKILCYIQAHVQHSY